MKSVPNVNRRRTWTVRGVEGELDPVAESADLRRVEKEVDLGRRQLDQGLVAPGREAAGSDDRVPTIPSGAG